MNTYQEKLGILSEMIAFARVDYALKNSEYQFLMGVAERLGVSKAALDKLLQDENPPKSSLRTQTDRIIQFHRLLLLMNIDKEQHQDEVRKLYNIGLGMGLPPSAIGQVLEVMHQYPKKAVPPKVLINIFKAYQN